MPIREIKEEKAIINVELLKEVLAYLFNRLVIDQDTEAGQLHDKLVESYWKGGEQ